MRKGIALICAVVCTGLPFLAFAQATTTTQSATVTVAPTPSGLTSCFSYYSFGSVQTSLSPNLTKVAAGAPIGFQGTITNNNAYPIVDANVYVKIFRLTDTTGGKDINGPDVVDWFQAVGPITLKAGQSEPISFSWDVPRGAQDGSYQAATYIASSDQFNLFGLTFTDDVTGSLTPFSVILGQSGSVGFDKNSVMVGSQPFYFAAFPPNVSATSTPAVSINVNNTTSAPQNASITWDLYSWDSITPGSLINSQTEQVSIGANATTSASYTVNDTSHSVYYLVGTLTEGATKSIVGIRFVRTGVDVPRLAFAGVTSYPLTANSTLFSCAHDMGALEAGTSTLTVQIVPTDPVERIVDSLLGKTPVLSYSGVIPGQEVAIAKAVQATPSSFNVVTDLYQNGQLLNSVSVPYICSALGASCGYSYTDIALIVAAVIVVLLLILIFALRRRKGPSTQSQL